MGSVLVDVRCSASVAGDQAGVSCRAQGASSISATVNGSNFWSPAKLTVTGPGTGVKAAVTFVGDDTLQVSVTVPATATPGAYTLNLANGDGGTATCSGCLTVAAGPTITSVSPPTVSPGQTTTFTVTRTGVSSDAKLTGPKGVSFSGLSVSSDGTTITATMSVAPTAPAGSNLPVTVKDGALGNYGTATDKGLTIT